jgi:glycosyltransferase involved in cell wall biosynthesis
MNILLVNHYAGSCELGMEYRPYYLAREWVRQGHRVMIAAASFSHVRVHSPKVSGWLTENETDGIRYTWVWTPRYKGNGIRRVINIFFFVGSLCVFSNRLIRQIAPDMVIASSTYPLDIVPARAIARRCHAKIIFEVHDLWPLSPIELGGMSRRNLFIILMQWAENLAYRKSDKVVSMLPKTMEHMLQHGMSPEKYVYIPNGVDVTEWQVEPNAIPEQHKQPFSRLRAEGHFIVGYTGAHGLANVLDNFIDAACQLHEYPITFVLIGQGPEKERLMLKTQLRKQTNVIFLPPVERKAMPSILQEMDVLYIGLKGDPIFRFGVSPNKLMDYMMAGKPVIYAIQSGNNIVEDSGCGVSISPEKPAEIVKAVLHLMNLSTETRIQMGQKGQAYILAHHDYRILAKQFLDTLGEIIS